MRSGFIPGLVCWLSSTVRGLSLHQTAGSCLLEAQLPSSSLYIVSCISLDVKTNGRIKSKKEFCFYQTFQRIVIRKTNTPLQRDLSFERACDLMNVIVPFNECEAHKSNDSPLHGRFWPNAENAVASSQGRSYVGT